jgi:hypothetical protein
MTKKIRPLQTVSELADAATLHHHYRQFGFVPLEAGGRQKELKELRELLQSALQLEHATIPPYLTGLYSMMPSIEWQISGVVRTIVVEEMLHMVLVANVLNAIGGAPLLTKPGFILNYPSYLPYHVDDIQIGLPGFSREFVQQGLAIERPKYVDPVRVATGEVVRMTIGEFYVYIESKLRALVKKYGWDAIYRDDLDKQVRPDMFYYDAGGQPIVVKSLETAIDALRVITDQGEGFERTIWCGDKSDPFPEVAHYFRFNELARGRLYEEGDTYESGPTGAPLHVPYDQAYPIAANVKIADYPKDSQVRAHAEEFNRAYSELLGLLEQAFNGKPDLLLKSVPYMYQLREAAQRIMKNPFPGRERTGLHAAPTFEYCPGK